MTDRLLHFLVGRIYVVSAQPGVDRRHWYGRYGHSLCQFLPTAAFIIGNSVQCAIDDVEV